MMKILKSFNQYLGICLFVCGVATASEDPDAGRSGEHVCSIILEVMGDAVIAPEAAEWREEEAVSPDCAQPLSEWKPGSLQKET